MPILSAVRNTTYAPAPKVFTLIPTSATAPEYGFHFHPKDATLTAYAFDNCAYFHQLETSDIEAKQLWCHYELLYGYTAGVLGQRYYIVPWIGLPAIVDEELTLEFEVTPHSIYTEDQTTEAQEAVRDLIKERNKPQSGTVDLVPETNSGIVAYWKAAGKNTSIKEDKLANGEDARIIIPKGNYVPGSELEKKYHVTIQRGNELLGRIRISFLKAMKQRICFLQLRKNGNLYEARFLKPNEIPSTFDDSNTMAVSTAKALAPYGVETVTIGDMACLDGQNNVLVSTDKALVFSADLTPVSGAGHSVNSGALNEAMISELFSKIVSYQYKDGQQLVNDGAHKVCIVVLVPWVLDTVRPNEGGVAAGITINSNPVQALITVPQHCYVFSYVKALREAYEAKKGSLFLNISASKVTVDSVSRGYLARAVVHELCHALFVRHTFAAAENQETAASIFQRYREWVATPEVGLSIYGEREADTGTKRNLFPLMRDQDLRKAVVDDYLVAINSQPPSSYDWPRITGLLHMVHLSENVVFILNTTNNIMDYKGCGVESTPTTDTDGTARVSFSPIVMHLQLFRYQWEVLRGTVQFLEAQT